MWKPKKKKKFKNKKVYIHYGANLFDPNKYSKPNYIGCKPYGLWASPKYCGFSWKDYCESEDFHIERLEKSFEFTLKKDTKILQIRSLKDAKPYFIEKPDEDIITDILEYLFDAKYRLDLERIYKEFDGIELFFSNNYHEFHYNSEIFNPWDVDSLVIWNYDKIKINEEKQKEAYIKDGNNILNIFDEEYNEYLRIVCLPDENNDYTKVLKENCNDERYHCRRWRRELNEISTELKESIWGNYCNDIFDKLEEEYFSIDKDDLQTRRLVLLKWYKEITKWIKIIRLVVNDSLIAEY